MFSLTLIICPLNASQQWTKIPLTLPGQELTCIGLSNKGVMFIGTAQELFRSVDQTKTWQKVFALNNDQKAINDINFDKENNVYICTQQGVFASKDNGDNWQSLFFNCNKQDKNIIGICVDYEKAYIYILKKDLLYKGKIGEDLWEKIDSIPNISSSEEDLINEKIGEQTKNHYTDISIDRYGKIYVSSTKGVFFQKMMQDHGLF